MGVLKPLKVIIENYPDDQVEEFDVENNPEIPERGTRKVPFSKEIYIEQDDFMIDPPRKYFRLKPDGEVRLKNAYFIKCTGYETDEDGNVTLVRATYDPASRGGESPDGRKVRGTIQWVSVKHALDAQIRLYDVLFKVESPDDIPEGGDYKDNINPDSLIVLEHSKVEPSLKDAKPEVSFQFLRTGYFCIDNKDSKPDTLVFNRTVGLRDSWAKIMAKK